MSTADVINRGYEEVCQRIQRYMAEGAYSEYTASHMFTAVQHYRSYMLGIPEVTQAETPQVTSVKEAK